MRKLHTRILVGAAVAACTGGAAFATVSVTDHPTTANTVALTNTASSTATTATEAKVGTTLSIAVTKATTAAGRLDVISGTLTTGTAPSGKRIVELYRYNATLKKWVPARVNLTRKGGGVRFAIRPLTTAEYELVYHGNTDLAAAHSVPVTITVTE